MELLDTHCITVYCSCTDQSSLTAVGSKTVINIVIHCAVPFLFPRIKVSILKEVLFRSRQKLVSCRAHKSMSSVFRLSVYSSC